MAHQSTDNIVVLRDGKCKLDDEVDSLEDITFDQSNGQTFTETEEWIQGDEPSIGNEDSKKDDVRDPNEIMSQINYSVYSLEMDSPTDDMSPEARVYHRSNYNTCWGPKRFEDSSPLKRNNYIRDRSNEPRFLQELVEERSPRELEEDFRRSEVYSDHGRYTTPRRGSGNFVGNQYKEIRSSGAMSPHAFSRRSTGYRSNNFDLRNAETFGFETVIDKPQYGGLPKSQFMPRPRGDEDFGLSENSFKVPEIRDPRIEELYKDVANSHLRERSPSYPNVAENRSKERLRDFKTSSLEHLRSIASLVPKIEIMEDIFDELTDPDNAPIGEVRAWRLEQLKNEITPQNVLPFSKMVHARRLLMHSLSLLSRHPNYRDHAFVILREMTQNLEKLLREDQYDEVFGLKNSVFKRIISNCNMEEILELTRALMTDNCDEAIQSTLGLVFMSCLMERASNLNFRQCQQWTDFWLPRIYHHISKIPKVTLNNILSEKAIKHLHENIKNFASSKASYESKRVTY